MPTWSATPTGRHPLLRDDQHGLERPGTNVPQGRQGEAPYISSMTSLYRRVTTSRLTLSVGVSSPAAKVKSLARTRQARTPSACECSELTRSMLWAISSWKAGSSVRASRSRARLRCCAHCAAASGATPGDELRFADLVMNSGAHQVWRGGVEISLTATEFRLLRFFLLNPGRVVSKAQILDNVWHYDFGGDTNILETYVSYLRRKLNELGPPLIHTVRLVGYVLREDPET